MRNKKFILGLATGVILSLYGNRVIELHQFYQSQYEDASTFEDVEVYGEGSLSPKNEHEVYELNDSYDGIYYLPLKALKVNVYNEDYVILSNNEGSAFIAEGNIKENENYIGVVSYVNNEEVLHSLIKSNFKFSKNSEDAFNMKVYENKVFFEREAVLLLNK